jgi:hypothetical protein
MKTKYIIKVKESCIATYLVKAEKGAEKETFDSGNYEILDVLDDGMGNMVPEEVTKYWEAEKEFKEQGE